MNHLRLLQLTRELERRSKNDPLPFMKWLPTQMDFLKSTAKRKLYRAGYQHSGKTTAGAAELIFRMMGDHPFKRVPPAPIRAWVICGARGQSRVVQRKVCELVPKHMVSPRCEFDEIRGCFVGEQPTLVLRNGSIAIFKSGGAKGVNITSDTLDYVFVDEVPDRQEVYDDLQARLLKSGGDLSLCFTPYHNPIGYLRERVQKGLIKEYHHPLEAKYLIPVGSTEPLRLDSGRPMDEDWVREYRATISPMTAPVFCDGEWETRYEGAYFDGAWRGEGLPDSHVMTAPPWAGKALKKKPTLCLGIDHGHKPGKQAAYLVFVYEDHVSGYPWVYVAGEYTNETDSNVALPEKDARGVLHMMETRKVAWADLDLAWGDRVHMPGSGQQKSNTDLMVEIGRILGVPWRNLLPQINTVDKFDKSVTAGERFLYAAMQRGTFGVHPSCKRLIDAIPKYCRADDGTKDPVDAIRYALMPYIRGWWRTTGGGRSLDLY